MKYWINLNESDAAFANMSAAIKSVKRTNDDEYLKPFPTCQTCDKWKTKNCIISRLCEDMLRNSNRDISKGIYPDHDFCCINHPDFAGAK